MVAVLWKLHLGLATGSGRRTRAHSSKESVDAALARGERLRELGAPPAFAVEPPDRGCWMVIPARTGDK